ncbi:hypothetical protein N7466_000923 [Penicillium verhagenii]|uniref:uncharacterized protein n=1 Tax=Penicillium verhagenii TaxID=1562060 RepID=UPI0025455C37|nr:uncharacterized protein N7466_000923 [Penicillium verhagenii]KAJ5947908.1 hypothetical protein N7466_000923 [Penicillium verhagenii]
MASNNSPKKIDHHRRILLISTPRTASNPLVKVLNIPNQPKTYTNEKGGYFFYPAFILAAQNGYLEKPVAQWTESEKRNVTAVYQSCLNSLEEATTRALAANKTMFVKEHAFWIFGPAAFQKKLTGVHDENFLNAFRVDTPEKYGPTKTYATSNETILSDEYLRSWQMAFIIRHPALSWPSFWRAMLKFVKEGILDEDAVEGTTMTSMGMCWARSLYDWCIEQPGLSRPPPVLDAYDLINTPGAVVRFAEEVGLDPDVLRFEWDSQDHETDTGFWASNRAKESAGDDVEGSHIRAANIMLTALSGSSGMITGRTPAEVDISAEVRKWKAEFGDEVAGIIESAVFESMPDYEYLKARRITV